MHVKTIRELPDGYQLLVVDDNGWQYFAFAGYSRRPYSCVNRATRRQVGSKVFHRIARVVQRELARWMGPDNATLLPDCPYLETGEFGP